MYRALSSTNCKKKKDKRKKLAGLEQISKRSRKTSQRPLGRVQHKNWKKITVVEWDSLRQPKVAAAGVTLNMSLRAGPAASRVALCFTS